MHPITIQGNDFMQNGRPIRILSGAMHYFRVMPDYWRDRLLKLRVMGLNTVETYVPWNLHEPRPDEFDFTGMLDIERYVRLAGELGLMVIVRPGPYICSEWDLGGLPWWLLAEQDMRVRCAYPPYLAAVDRYFDALLSRLAPLQTGHGGPIVLMQVENEYGSFGNDKVYLRHLADGMRQRGIDVPLFTSDGDCDWMLQGGTLPDIHKVVNFGSDPVRNFRNLRRYQPEGPLMCGEFWNGWFDHWGEPHHLRAPEDAAACLDALLAAGGSVNFYMFHGGTNFGYMAGANHTGTTYQPDVTSYDYDAPLTEAGDPTPKYFACREVIGKYVPLPPEPVPGPLPKRAYGTVELTESVALWDALDALSTPVSRATPEPMELLGQSYGFILYRTTVRGPREECPLVLQQVHDRAQIFVDRQPRDVIDRNMAESPVKLGFDAGVFQLDIFVEAMGRVNYGPQMLDRKGITEGVRLSNQFLFGWTIYPLPLDDLSALSYNQTPLPADTPAFHRGHFTVDTPADTYLALPGWTKGICWINGFNLGRYWEEKGPQHTLYIPAPLLRQGENEIVVFELHGCREARVELRESPDLG